MTQSCARGRVCVCVCVCACVRVYVCVCVCLLPSCTSLPLRCCLCSLDCTLYVSPPPRSLLSSFFTVFSIFTLLHIPSLHIFFVFVPLCFALFYSAVLCSAWICFPFILGLRGQARSRPIDLSLSSLLQTDKHLHRRAMTKGSNRVRTESPPFCSAEPDQRATLRSYVYQR